MACMKNRKLHARSAKVIAFNFILNFKVNNVLVLHFPILDFD